LRSLRARLLAVFLLPPLLLLTAAGFFGFRSSRAVLEEELAHSLSATAGAIASQLSVERVLELTEEDFEGEGSRLFNRLKKELEAARVAADLRRVVVFDQDGKVRLDAGGRLPPRADFPELARDRLELGRVFQGRRAASQVMFEANDGKQYKTGYAPLMLEGQVVGAVAVEGSAGFFAPLRQLFWAYVGVALATLLLLAVSALLFSRALSRPLEHLVESALRIGGGDLETKVPPQPSLEIGILARELEAMRASLLSRDQQLKLMLGGVAHEVRNPLGGIELFSGLLKEELASPKPDLAESQAHLSKIRTELDYLKRLVDDFLAFAREQKLARAPFDAKEWLEGAAAHVAGDATKKEVRLEVQPHSAQLEGDQSLLTSAVVNLLKNAVQASPSGKQVTLRGGASDGHYVVEVEDEGPGIPAEKQAQIFEPFFTTREKGSGLGLPLARKLAEAHRGTLTLESRPGRTCFRLRVPVSAPASPS
jgi:signal transduction histidine kinase